MALFTKTTKKKKKAAAPKAPVVQKESALAAKVLLKPRITEKSYALNANGQYVFEVAKTSTKQSITQAVQEAFGVNVTDVRVVNLPGKSKAFGKKQIMGKRSGIKKALVQLAEGQSIELFKGGL